MGQVRLNIDGQEIEVQAGATILEAARGMGIYIPTLCSHPDLPHAEGIQSAKAIYQGERKIENVTPGKAGKGCGICIVEVEGEADPVESCSTEARKGMVVITNNDRIKNCGPSYN